MTFDDVNDEAPDQEFDLEEAQVVEDATDQEEPEEEASVGAKAHPLMAAKFRTLTHITVLDMLAIAFATICITCFPCVSGVHRE